MNILFLTYQGDIAGSTRSIFYLADGLAMKGHNVFVGCRQESLLYRMLQKSPATAIAMKFKGRLDRDNMKHIRDIVVGHKIDLINAQSSYDRYTSIIARWIYKLPVKLVHTRRQRPRSDGGWLQKQFYVKGTDKIVVVSEELKKMFIDKGYPEDHIHPIFNGIPNDEILSLVDDSAVVSLREKYNLKDNDIVIGCVSREKSQEELIRALKYLDAGWKIIFVGIDQDFLQKYMDEEDVKQDILFVGKKDFAETVNHYKLFDLNVLPSKMDGFGLVIAESMLLGSPVVGAAMGGIKDVIEDGVSGLLYEFGNSRDLADKISTLICDSEFRRKVVMNGKQRAQHFSINNTVNNYEEFFQNLIKE